MDWIYAQTMKPAPEMSTQIKSLFQTRSAATGKCTRNFPISDLFTIDTWYTFHRKLSFSLTQNITQQMVLLNLLLVTFSRLLWNRDFIHAFKLFSINSYCASYSGSHIENWHSIMRMGLLNASGTKHQVLSLIFISIHRIIECEPLHRMYCRHFSH